MSFKLLQKHILASSIAIVLGSSFATTLLAAEEQTANSEDEVIVITGIRGSLKANVNQKRFADSVSDVITAEDIGKFPDKNVAESLSRITGVAVTRDFGEGEKITIRGSGPSQNRTLLNGQNVGTADWFILDQPSRGFNYTLLPSSLVKSLSVHKSAEANVDEGSIGGTVIIDTRRPLEMDANTVVLSLQTQYSETSGKNDPQIDGLFSWKNDEEDFGFLLSLTKQERTVQREGLEVLGWSKVDENYYPRVMGNPIFKQDRERQTAFASIQFVPSDNFDITLNVLDSKMDANNANANLLIWPANEAAVLQDTTMIGNSVVAGTVDAGGSYEWDFINRESSTETASYDLDINYDGDGFSVHVEIGTTEASGGTYNEASWSFAPNVDPADSGYSYDLTGTPSINIGVDPTNGALWGQNWTWGGNKPTTDEETYAQVDFDFDIEWQNFTSIEAGMKIRDHDRTQSRQAYSWHGPGTRPSYPNWGGYLGYIFEQCPTLDTCGQTIGTHNVAGSVLNGNVTTQLMGDREQFMNLAFAGEADFAKSDNLAEIWDINESITAAYVKGSFDGDNYRGNVGLRVVKTEQEASSYEFSGDSWGLHTVDREWLTPAYLEWVSEERSYTEVLPSFNLAYNLADDRILRVAAARVMARPNYSDLAPMVSLGSLNGVDPTATAGNPNLKPTLANQFDIAYEWYFDDSAIASATFFYKDVESYRSTSSYMEEFYNLESDEWVDVSVIVPTNGTGGTTTGLEFGYQQGFGDLGIAANYTYTDANNDGERVEGNDGSGLVAGSSEHMFNTTFFYEIEDFGARLMYNYRSEYFVGPHWNGGEIFTDGFGQLDFSSSYSVTDNIDVVLEIVNLTNEKVVQFNTEPARLMSIYENGRRVVLGVTGSF